MKNKLFHLIIFLILLIPLTVFSHGNHGPKLNDVGVFGGVVSNIVKYDQRRNHHAKIIYKAELVRIKDKGIKVFIYDGKMKLLKSSELNTFSKKVDAYLISYKSGKRDREKFSLDLKGKIYQGIAPKNKTTPYAINIIFENKGVKYFTSFDNLD
jgi:hypothetical protein